MAEPEHTTKRDQFYGWIIVAVATLALVVSNGLSIGGIPVFYKPIQEDLIRLGSITPDTADRMTGDAASLTFLLAGIFSLVAGQLLRWLPIRTLMTAGCILLGGGLALYALATHPWHIYLCHSLLGLSLGLVGVMMQTVLIANWFSERRGTAMGIVLMGTSIGGVLVPVIARPLITSYGWRTAILTLSGAVWVVLLPAVLALVRSKPVENDNVGAPSPTNEASGLTLSEAVRTSRFWILAICAAAIFYPIFTTSQQFILHIQKSPSIAVDAATASIAQSFLFATSVGGKFLFGWMSDRIATTRVMIICCGMMFLATLLLLGFLSAGTVFVFLVPFGLGYGGTFVLLQLLAVEFFGLKDTGRIIGALTVIETVGAAIGGSITGRVAASHGGDYTVAFYGVTIAAGIALLSVIALNAISSERSKP